MYLSSHSKHTHSCPQAPTAPGEYEVRYYPAWLQGIYTGYKHSSYIAVTHITVVSANWLLLLVLYFGRMVAAYVYSGTSYNGLSK